MKVVILGSLGQVGFELMRAAWPVGTELVGLSRADLDVADEAAVGDALVALRPSIVVNATAYTAVDRAEGETALAFAVNCDGAGHVARACARTGAVLIHYSTDYVFDGSKPDPYQEDDPVAPLGTYGRSKEAGERRVRELCPAHLILRTSWVFGAHCRRRPDRRPDRRRRISAGDDRLHPGGGERRGAVGDLPYFRRAADDLAWLCRHHIRARRGGDRPRAAAPGGDRDSRLSDAGATAGELGIRLLAHRDATRRRPAVMAGRAGRHRFAASGELGKATRKWA